MEVGEEGAGDYIPIAICCHHQNDFCIKMGSDESHFNVSLIARYKVTRQRPQTTTFFKEKGEPKRNRTEVLLLTSLTKALPLGQTGSPSSSRQSPTSSSQPGDCHDYRTTSVMSEINASKSAPFLLCGR